MPVIIDTHSLEQSRALAQTAAHVAHEAQPYPQDSAVFKGLAKLANAMSDASLRCLQASLAQEEPPAAPEQPEEPAETLLGSDPAEAQDDAPLS